MTDGEYFTVTGGAASSIALTEDLMRAVRALTDAAALMDSVTGASARAQTEVQENWFRGEVLDRLDDVMHGPRGSRRVADHLGDIAARLATTVRAMEQAEADAQRSVGMIQGMWERQTGLWGAMWWAGASAYRGMEQKVPWPHLSLPLPDPGTLSTTAWLDRDTVEFAVGAMAPAMRDALLRAAICAQTLGEHLGRERAWAYARPAPGGDELRAPHHLYDLIWNDWVTEQRGDSAVGIQTVVGGDGAASYIVTIPGTQDWGLEDNIFDGRSNLEMMRGPLAGPDDHYANGTADPLAHVAAAMALAGIPAGANVMLVGHSQGGIVASTLASSPAFTEKYRVTHVVTTGSPTGTFFLQPGVKALHLEHPEDIVPGTDGTPVTPTAHRTVFSHDMSHSSDPRIVELSQTIAGAHCYEGYLATAALAESGVSGSVDAFMESAAEFLDPHATVTGVMYVPGWR